MIKNNWKYATGIQVPDSYQVIEKNENGGVFQSSPDSEFIT